MAKTDDRIDGSGLFDDKSVDAAFRRFKEYIDTAKKQTKSLKSEILKVNAALKGNNLKKLKRDVLKLDSAVRKLKTQNDKLKTSSNQLTTSMKKEGKGVDKLAKKYKGLNKNKGTLTKSTKKFGLSIGSLLKGFGLYSLIQGVVSLGKSAYKTAKDIDTMNLTLGKVTETAYEFGRSQEFLADTSERFGLNIVKATKKFATFYASAKQSNFTLKQTMDIFETFSNAGASLGKSSADLDRIFLALEQMMSKGKVSSEELRRQLGEVLPGAVSIMAKSMGVSNAALEKMLKKGEVMAYDVLPKFAEEVKKTFSLDNSERIETMAANQERLTNSWVEFVRVLTEDDGVIKDFINGTLKTLAGAIEEITKWFRAMGDPKLTGNLAVIVGTIKEIPGAIEDIIYSIVTVLRLIPGVNGLYKEFKKMADEVERLNKIHQNREATKALNETYNAARKAYEEYGKMMKFDKIQMQQYILDLGSKSKAELDSIYDYWTGLMALVKKKDDNPVIIDPKKAKKEADKAFKLLEKGWRDYIRSVKKMMKEFRKDLADNQKDYLSSLDDVDYYFKLKAGNEEDAYTKKILLIQLERKAEIRAAEEKIKDAELLFKVLEELKKKYDNKITEAGPATNEDTPGEGILGKLFGFTEKEIKSIQEKAAEVVSIIQSTTEAIAAIQYAAFEARDMQLDYEEQRMTDYYDNKMKLAEGDADLQEKIRIRQAEDEEKLEKKRKKLEYDRAKARKNQAIVDATINIALAITKAMTVTGWALGAAIAVAALGAIQLGVIATSPLPKYAMGTDNHKGGLAIVGDGGKQELAISPSGSMYLTSNKPELINMEKGSKVIPDAKDFIQKEMIKMFFENSVKNTEMMVDTIADAVLKGFKNTRINNKNNINVSLDYQLWRGQIVN